MSDPIGSDIALGYCFNTFSSREPVSASLENALGTKMDERLRKPRIDDVARRAGVSTATVSRALATPDQVKPKTREAVEKAVLETGYVLNVAARNLRTNRTHAVLAVVPDVANIFFSQVLRGISDTLHQHGYRLVIADTGNDPERRPAGSTASCC